MWDRAFGHSLYYMHKQNKYAAKTRQLFHGTTEEYHKLH